jgi:hypothetical protein
MTDTSLQDLAGYDISELRLGKSEAVRPIGLLDLMTYTPAGFPAAPPFSGNLTALQGISWRMDGNDVLGDCTIAGVDHVIAAENALLNTKDERPDLKVLEAQYRALSPKDLGCVIATVLQTWRSTGMFKMPTGPNKLARYAPFDHRNRTEFCEVIAFTGTSYIGIACPKSAQQQFAKQVQTGQLVPWTVVAGSPIAGGHCIVAVGYTDEGLLCVSWGGVVLVTWPFITKYCDEAWALLTEELSKVGHDTFGLDVTQLDGDLNRLRPAS